MEGSDAGRGAPPAGTTPPPDPAAGGDGGEGSRKRGPHPDAGKYVVLMSQVPQTEGEAASYVVATAEPIFAGDARDAKKKAIESNERLRELVAGDGVLLVAIPAMSFKPAIVKAEQPPPIMRGL